MLRVTTRRILRSATSLDLVVIFLLGGFAMPSILNGDQSLTGAVLGMSTVAGLHFALSRLRTLWPFIGQITEGTAVSIYARQGFDENQMLRARLTMQDIVAEMRQSGLSDLGEVEAIIVEHNGAITVMPRSAGSDVS